MDAVMSPWMKQEPEEENALPNAQELEARIKARLEEYDSVQVELRPMKKAMKPMEEKIKEIKADIAAMISVLGHSVQADGLPWSADYVRGYKRVIWNKKALEGYELTHPELAALKSEKEIAPTGKLRFVPPKREP